MSNRRKLPGTGPARRCTACGGGIGKLQDALVVRTGQLICPRCRERGGLERLPCGHYVLPGTFVVANAGGDGTRRCQQCAPDIAAAAGNLRLGMAPGRQP